MCNTYLYMRNEPENKRGVDSYMHITPTLLYAHPVYPWITRLSVACTQTTYIRTCERIKITCCPIKPTIRIMRRQHLLYTQSTHTHTELKCIIMTTQYILHTYVRMLHHLLQADTIHTYSLTYIVQILCVCHYTILYSTPYMWDPMYIWGPNTTLPITQTCQGWTHLGPSTPWGHNE